MQHHRRQAHRRDLRATFRVRDQDVQGRVLPPHRRCRSMPDRSRLLRFIELGAVLLRRVREHTLLRWGERGVHDPRRLAVAASCATPFREAVASAAARTRRAHRRATAAMGSGAFRVSAAAFRVARRAAAAPTPIAATLYRATRRCRASGGAAAGLGGSRASVGTTTTAAPTMVGRFRAS